MDVKQGNHPPGKRMRGVYSSRNPKCSLGENAIIFDEMGEGQEPSSINYCRYDFLIKSVGKAACSFCFYAVNSKVTKVI